MCQLCKPSVPQIESPRIAPKAPVCYWYGLLGSAGWSIGWPMFYAVTEPEVTRNATLLWLTHAAATIWFFSLIGFFVFLVLIADYSPTASAACEFLGWLVDLLGFLVDLFSWF
jgi:hypothetical protein